MRLYDAASFAELAVLPGRRQAQLSTGYPEGAGGLCFSPDGHILAMGTMRGTIWLWDLRLIRDQLDDMGLDWDLQPFR